MNFTKELIEKAKTAKSAEDLLAMAKSENVELTAAQAEKAFADLHHTGALADEELDNVSGGCSDPEPATQWGQAFQWDKSEDVRFDFAVGTRVLVYITPSTWGKGTVTAKECRKNDWGWYPAYLVRHDDSSVADEWYGQANVGKLL